VISVKDLRDIAQARLKDSEVLCEAKRYDGAAYLCGYVVELALKAKICDTLKWKGFPETKGEFENYRSFRTHSLDVLLSLTGVEQEVKTKFLAEWSIAAKWDPEVRYKAIGTAKQADANLMIQSTRALLGIL
jgi:hypothetical protein